MITEDSSSDHSSFAQTSPDSKPSLKKTISSKLFDLVWPVYRHELPLFLLTTGLYFCILLVQNFGRAMKDSIINTLVGPETTTFLKIGGVLPTSLIATALYIKLLSLMHTRQIFYLIFLGFISFFIIFAFVLFPNYNLLHLADAKVQAMIMLHPHFKWLILAISNWVFSLFYVIVELWPGIALSLLFWQFVNNVTTVEQSKRFYILFGLLGQTGLYISGQILRNMPNITQWVIDTYQASTSVTTVFVQTLTFFIVCAASAAVLIFYLINRYLVDNTNEELQFKAQKKHPSLSQSLKFVMQSRYIGLVALLLICYGAAINLIELPWKAKAAKLYTKPEDYIAFVGNYLSYNGLLTVLLVVVGSNIIRRLGWLAGAMITPVILFSTGLVFFLILNYEGFALWLSNSLQADPLFIAVAVGTIQNVTSKSTKYTLFDATKEMTYVPLESELRIKGKAAAEVVGTKLGKALGSGIQVLLFTMIPSATGDSVVSVALMILFSIVCIIWIVAIWNLNKEYSTATQATKE